MKRYRLRYENISSAFPSDQGLITVDIQIDRVSD